MEKGMIERVAKAHYDASIDPRVEPTWEACHPDYRAQQVRVMRAAIGAMRDVDLDVLGAGYNAMFETRWDATQAPMMGAGWDAMIDAALSEPSPQAVKETR